MALMSHNQLGSSPAVDFAAITPSNTVNLARPTRGIYVGSIANGAVVVAVTYAGVAVTFSGVLAGTILPIQAIRVNSTSTTAESLVALY